jgi:hypothetical protein
MYKPHETISWQLKCTMWWYGQELEIFTLAEQIENIPYTAFAMSPHSLWFK